jgi:hypothetical protein
VGPKFIVIERQGGHASSKTSKLLKFGKPPQTPQNSSNFLFFNQISSKLLKNIFVSLIKIL